MKREIKFMFDYNCAPLWLSGEEYWDYLVNSNGYFVGFRYTLISLEPFEEETTEIRVPENRLKGEVELEKKVKLIFETYSRIFEWDTFQGGKPFGAFADEKDKNNFYDACDFVIKRMREIFGDEFSVNEYDERVIKERSLGCREK